MRAFRIGSGNYQSRGQDDKADSVANFVKLKAKSSFEKKNLRNERICHKKALGIGRDCETRLQTVTLLPAIQSSNRSTTQRARLHVALALENS